MHKNLGAEYKVELVDLHNVDIQLKVLGNCNSEVSKVNKKCVVIIMSDEQVSKQ